MILLLASDCYNTLKFDCGLAGSPKSLAKLLTMSESGRLRSPPLVEKFRRTKENMMLQSIQAPPPTNNKLLSLEQMFREVSSHLCKLAWVFVTAV